MDGSTWIDPLAKRRTRLLARMVRCLALWRRRSRERTVLATLDDRMLADIGINRLDRARECQKPFWRA